MRLTDHAVLRFQERVRPTLTLEQSKRELLRLVPGAERVDTLEWHEPGDDAVPPDEYLILSDGIALVVYQGHALTCITRAGLSEGGRRYRIEKRRKKQRHRREAAQHKKGKMHRAAKTRNRREAA